MDESRERFAEKEVIEWKEKDSEGKNRKADLHGKTCRECKGRKRDRQKVTRNKSDT